MSSSESVTDLLDALRHRAQQDRKVFLGDVVSDIGARGVGPLLFVPALLVLSPLGTIPLVPSVFAVVLLLIALQSLVGESGIWLPEVLRNRSLTPQKVDRAQDRLRPAARWLDRHFGERLTRFTTPLMQKIATGLAAVLCLMVPPLELVPMAALIPMLGVALLGLAITFNDGILMMVALIGAGAALIGGAFMLISG